MSIRRFLKTRLQETEVPELTKFSKIDNALKNSNTSTLYMWYVASSSGSVQRLFKSWPRVRSDPALGSLFSLKLDKPVRPRYDICYIILSSVSVKKFFDQLREQKLNKCRKFIISSQKLLDQELIYLV